MLRILNREGADPSGAGVDQYALAGAGADAGKSLQGGQPYQRQRRGFRWRDGRRLERDELLRKRDPRRR